MKNQNNNIKISKETLDICKHKKYTSPSGKVVDLSFQLNFSKEKTILYEDLISIELTHKVNSFIEVRNETTAEGALRLLNQGKKDIVALNFASARNPGGGFLNGAVAQEEDLCRCSGLYHCLKSKPIFYNKNILCDDTYYNNDIIYSPNVPFFRDINNLLLEDPFMVSIISAPAPNIRVMKEVDEGRLQSILNTRVLKILQIAYIHNHKNLILGAWGCGAFGNKPEMVVSAFIEALKIFPAFEHVCFSVFDSKPEMHTFNTFNKLILS